MRIKQLSIEGFGHFNQSSFGPFEAPMVILYGPNEAGKSTLLNFMRTVLFGFPTRNRDEYYPPQLGGKHGGRIVVADDSGMEYVIERYAGPHRGPVTINGVAGEGYPSVKLSQLLGSATKDVFGNVFAFSLDELQTSDLLADENINSQIYSAGLGITNLPDLFKQMTVDMEKIYRPGGSKPIANSVAAELDGIAEKIREITENSERYSALKDSVEKADEEIVELAGQRQDMQNRRIELASMKDAWIHWIGLLDVEQQLKGLPFHPRLPSNPLEELEQKQSTLAKASDEFNDAQEQLEATELDAAAIQPDKLILEDEPLLAQINQRKSSIEKSEQDLPERKSELASQTTIVESCLSYLGPGWDRERLETTEIVSYPVVEEIRGHRTSISDQNQKVLTLAGRLTALKNAFTQEKNALTRASEQVSGASQPEYNQSELDSRQKAVDESETINHEYQIWNSAHERLQRLSGRDEELSGNLLDTVLMPGILAVVAILVILAGTIIGQHLMFTYGMGVILLGVGGSFYLYNRANSGRIFRSGGTASNLEESQKELQEIRDRLVESLSHIELDMEGIGRLDAVRKEYDGIQDQIDEWKRLRDAVLEAEKQMAKQSSLVDDLETALQKEETRLNQMRSNWKQWLSERELPLSLTPEDMGEYRGQIVAGRKELEAEKRMQGRAAAVQTDIDQYSVLATPMAEKHGVDFESKNVTSLIMASDNLVKRLDVAKGHQIQKKQRLVDLAKRKQSLEWRKKELEEANGALDSLLEQVGAPEVDAYRVMARDQSERDELSNQKHKFVNALQMLSGPKEQLDVFKRALTNTSIAEIKSQLIQVNENLRETEEQHTGLVERKAQANLEIKLLINEDEFSTLQVRKSQLLEQLSVSALTWARLRLAGEMLERGRDKFQEERQPGVIKHAQEFFGNITNNRYHRLIAPIGEQTVTVRDKINEKTPDQLSRGTREQLYLSLRLGLIKEYGEHSETLPVIVDEILVNFDPKRAQRACSAFSELSKTNQVLVFTCHPEMVQYFREAAVDVQVIDIA